MQTFILLYYRFSIVNKTFYKEQNICVFYYLILKTMSESSQKKLYYFFKNFNFDFRNISIFQRKAFNRIPFK